MGEADHQTPTLATLLTRLGRTGLGSIRNRAELLAVEWEEEKARLSRLLILSLGLTFLGALALGLMTLMVVVLVPVPYRVWALGGFAVLYAAGCLWSWLTIRTLLRKEPFAESILQLQKDTQRLEGE